MQADLYNGHKMVVVVVVILSKCIMTDVTIT